MGSISRKTKQYALQTFTFKFQVPLLPMTRSRVTIRDVAAHAGVSHQTVSRVINGTDYVTPETTARVQQAIADLNYRPNAIARSMARGRTGLIYLVQTALGRFVDPGNPANEVMQNVRLSMPVETLTAHPQNYRDVVELQGLDRSLTNTILVTLLVVVGTLTTSVVGGYAFARLRFPGRRYPDHLRLPATPGTASSGRWWSSIRAIPPIMC
jgi:ABC-type glycerol-3-phosphate transport system permease component